MRGRNGSVRWVSGLVVVAAFAPVATPAAQERSAGSATLTVTVAIKADAGRGQVGCALFASPQGFPLDSSSAQANWQAADSKVTCRFSGLAPGTYAVAVSHDLDGNRTTNRNFLGIPTEAWGVSNNVRPRLRAPRFAEASVNVAADQSIAIEVRK